MRGHLILRASERAFEREPEEPNQMTEMQSCYAKKCELVNYNKFDISVGKKERAKHC